MDVRRRKDGLVTPDTADQGDDNMSSNIRTKPSQSTIPRPHIVCFALISFLFALFFTVGSVFYSYNGVGLFSYGSTSNSRYPNYPIVPQIPDDSDCYSRENGYGCNTEVAQIWAQYSPFYSSNSTVLSKTDVADVRDTCTRTQVQAVFRHGSRVATPSRAADFEALIKRLKSTVSDEFFVGKWGFLKTYNCDMFSIAGLLTKFGEQEMYLSGKRFYQLYSDLLSDRVEEAKQAGSKRTPGLAIRVGNINRVLVSAQNFSAGFYGSAQPDQDLGPITPMVLIAEDSRTNNTLHHTRCATFENWKHNFEAHGTQNEWEDSFTGRIASRISAELGGTTIKGNDVISLFELCAFETSAILADNLHQLHPICGLFSVEDFRLFDYYHTRRKYYAFGPGSSLGAAQGVGYVREVISRLTGTPVQPAGAVNTTLDANFETFPYGEFYDVYADFSHDNDMLSYYAALMLFQKPLPKDHYADPEDVDGFSIARIASFGARMYIEKWDCGEISTAGNKVERVAIVINERPIPMDWCASPVQFADGTTSEGKRSGTCVLDTFVKGIMAKGDYGFEENCQELLN